MQRLLLCVFAVLLLLSAGNTRAQPIDEGVAAHARGDFANALRIFRSLAAQGHAKAQFKLGVLYDNGQGVARDYVRAHMWFHLGAESGDDHAAQNRDIVAKRMTPQQLAEAQKLAYDCKRRLFKGCD